MKEGYALQLKTKREEITASNDLTPKALEAMDRRESYISNSWAYDHKSSL